jgi:hypothetical protein
LLFIDTVLLEAIETKIFHYVKEIDMITLLCSPTIIVRALAAMSTTQWAAVRTYRDEIREPPQRNPPLRSIRIWNGME